MPLEQHYITKIEGHGSLKINFREGTAKLRVEEGERLFEGLVLDKNFQDIPWIVSRICGVCPTVHCLTAIKALENALEITPNQTIVKFRKLMLCAQIIQSHVLHLFFLALPDYLGMGSGLGVAGRYPAEFRLAIELKRLSDRILMVVGGRPVHPITPVVGGFTKFPLKSELSDLQQRLENTLDEAEDLARLFASLEYPKISRPTEYLALEARGEYGYYGGMVASSERSIFAPTAYQEEIEETIRLYSPAKFSRHRGRRFMVGALARLNLQTHLLNPRAHLILEEIKIHFPSSNPFHNNVAQAVEIVHFTEEALKIVGELLTGEWGAPRVAFEIKPGRGVGAMEAPRGILYHAYEIGKNGEIIYCDIVTPTAQNLLNLEEDAKELLKVSKRESQPSRQQLIEMLIRAYDPCITCSVH